MECPPLFCRSLLDANPALMFHGAGMRWPRSGRHRMVPPIDTAQPLHTFLFNYEAVNVYVDGVATPLPPMSLALWNDKVSVDYGDAGKEWRVSWLQFWGEEADKLLSGVKVNSFHPFPNDAVELRYFGGVIDELQRYRHPQIALLLLLLQGLVFEYAREAAAERVLIELPLLEAKRRIEEFYRAPSAITLPSLARRAGMSISHFSRKYKAAFGLAPLEYAMNLRLDEIVARMPDPDMNLGELAKAVGFNNMSNFSRTFRRHFGISPARCRTQTAKGKEAR